MGLLRAFIDYCLLPSHNYEEKIRRREKTLATYRSIEKQLDDEAEVSYQRHFETVGRRIRRAVNQCS